MTQPNFPPQGPYAQQPQGPYAQQPPVPQARKKSGLLWLITLIAVLMVIAAIAIGVSTFTSLTNFSHTMLPQQGSQVFDLKPGGYVVASDGGPVSITITDDRTQEPLEMESISGDITLNDFQGLYGFVLEEPTPVRFTVNSPTASQAVLLPFSPEEFIGFVTGTLVKIMLAVALGGLGMLLAIIFGIWALVRTFSGRGTAPVAA